MSTFYNSCKKNCIFVYFHNFWVYNHVSPRHPTYSPAHLPQASAPTILPHPMLPAQPPPVPEVRLILQIITLYF